MPADTGMGFVVTQHLDAGHHSLLADLLSKFTVMTVVQVENGMGVEPNRVYVIPPNSYMTVSDGVLLLKPPADPRGMRMPIDRFLNSLAADQHDCAIGIILSGTGSDGALGVREIKASGGMVLVQDPETAQYDGMPRSAIATGQADAVLPLERMPEVLLSYVRHAYMVTSLRSCRAPRGDTIR
jgi:two-component system CheB/CheR fusion protein